jgi:PKD repeat protein
MLSTFFCGILFSQNLVSPSEENTVPLTVTAAFSVNAAKQCITGNSFVLTNSSSAAAGTSYFWDFGDGTTSTDANPVKVYNRSGNFRIHLEVRNGSDNAFVEKFIDVMPKPNVSFNTLKGTYDGKSYTFISSSTIESGTMNYFWSFGDGTTSNSINPTKAFTAAGSYNVKLIVTSDFGCKDSITEVINQGVAVCPSPVSAFTVNTPEQCKNTNRFNFTNTSSVSSGSLTYAWDFGDGTSSTDANPVKIYVLKGSYTVKLTVTNSLNGTCSTSVTSLIKVVGPEAKFVPNPVSEQCLKNNLVNFTNESSVAGNGVTYNWNFADGATATTANPTHTYTNAGTYNVSLAVYDPVTNCTDTAYVPVKMYPSPVASFTVVNPQTCNAKNFSFNNTSSINGDGVNYSWFFGDNNSSIDVSPSHTYSTLGTHTVTLIASSSHGCNDTATRQITAPEIVAAFTINPTSIQCFKNNAFIFTNSSHASTSGLQYDWDLSGGVTATNTNPSRSFNAPGTYNIRLIAKTPSNGCADTIFHSLTVNPSPTVDFSSSLSSYTNNNLTVNLNSTASVASGSLNYAWFFGDGQSSVSANPTHIYSNNVAERTISLTVSTDKGCSETVTKTISMVDGISRVVNNSFVNTNNNNVSSGADAGGINVYPNPAQNFVQIRVQNQQNNNSIAVRIIDFNGRVVVQRTEPASGGNTTVITINIQNINVGNYFVEALNANGVRMAAHSLVKR